MEFVIRSVIRDIIRIITPKVIGLMDKIRENLIAIVRGKRRIIMVRVSRIISEK